MTTNALSAAPLFQANLALSQRVGDIMQRHARECADACQRHLAHPSGEAGAALQQALQDKDLQQIGPAWFAFGTEQWQQRCADAQAAFADATRRQAALNAELGEALRDWQQAVGASSAALGDTHPALAFWRDAAQQATQAAQAFAGKQGSRHGR